jgi:HD-GYP domain-containing protein (c-di-GMP phosphodiesterase class II)
MLMTTMIVSAASAALPSALWGRGWLRMRRRELEYNVRVAQSLGHVSTLRDHETGLHNVRVAYLASMFGVVWGLDKTRMRSLMKGAFLHDIGKIGIPDSILLKAGSHDEQERVVMQRHPELGQQLLSDMPWFQDAIPVVLYHHERFDGTGYPHGLVGTDIPIAARLFAVIDVFDALLSSRPYKKALSLEKTLHIIRSESGSHFDPAVAELFLRLAPGFFGAISEHTEMELEILLRERRRQVFGR